MIKKKYDSYLNSFSLCVCMYDAFILGLRTEEVLHKYNK